MTWPATSIVLALTVASMPVAADTPASERLDGTFRGQVLELLKPGGAELPDNWEARHELIERLVVQWEKLGLDWDTATATNGLGVSPTLNSELDTLYEKWLVEFKIGDPATMTDAQLAQFKKDFDKFNAAIREYYKAYVILPTDTLEQVGVKEKAWGKVIHPSGSNKAGDTDKWKAAQGKQSDAIWALIRDR